jgi:hypothetical protein
MRAEEFRSSEPMCTSAALRGRAEGAAPALLPAAPTGIPAPAVRADETTEEEATA